MRRALIAALLTLLLTVTAVTAGAVTTNSGQTRGVVLFVGDSNVTLAAQAIEMALTLKDDHYVPVLASRMGARIRSADCLVVSTCTTFDYWRYKLASLNNKVNADVIVNNLGINDTAVPGTATTPGYAFYGRKIDWFMSLVRGKPVFWTTLPCALEPLDRRLGCKTVDYELYRARERWPNLKILAWGTRASSHPGYMLRTGSVHYSEAGYASWAALVASALDARLPAP
jgi:hypothetical protein